VLSRLKKNCLVKLASHYNKDILRAAIWSERKREVARPKHIVEHEVIVILVLLLESSVQEGIPLVFDIGFKTKNNRWQKVRYYVSITFRYDIELQLYVGSHEFIE